MLWVGAAGQHVDIIVGTARLARENARRRVAADRPSWGGFARLRLPDEHASAVMHDRILHCRLQLPSLAGSVSLIQRTDDAERQQHASAGVADRRPGLQWLAVGFAGNAHRATDGLGDRIKAQSIFVRTAGAKALDLGID